ncbi:hypothetical protein CSTERTH_10120 [Thermoclostridium stercorarium subsp. thermolacticum DSM 2910]|jgi:hypothetical protein|uniref:Uncharacterized protein n=1 Tax=Thermoclostridium stercorarium subsp. thermolacticum DSM 2910 TaxID=1121336 RepID=A0A1B1YF23_THEST|nr:hypothetical protein [Thermoclostridium stercorarium]AGI40042.1 hypothetical protein Clst_2004 [Thermoclostridium stercorarium subsp. stercorarium DSM 8532]ANW99361.1 hypothetical protein CSTERTH_10120 [Thermoclostridium stercorarium subsp. thermolacticum DSM 2910]UZQ85031.1 hypothetical protein ODU73_002123 [Thermoclostridium stercorarium]
MSISYYLIIPEIILTTGIIITAILSLKKEKIAESKGDISLGSLSKEEILKLSQNELKELRKVVSAATGCLFLITLLIALGGILLFEISAVNFAVCLFAQVLFTVIFGIPFMKRIKSFKRV